MTAEKKGDKCPRCRQVIYGSVSQWEAHARTHTRLSYGRRRWKVRKAYWSWDYELVNPRERYPKLWVERTEAKRGIRPSYIACRQVVPRGRIEQVLLVADGAASARAEAARLLDIEDWSPFALRQRRPVARVAVRL